MSLDDFDSILGNEFFQRAKVTLLPHLNRMFIMDETQPCYVHGLNKPPKKSSKEETISTLQVEKGLRNGKLTYVIALIKIKLEKMVEVLMRLCQFYKVCKHDASGVAQEVSTKEVH